MIRILHVFFLLLFSIWSVGQTPEWFADVTANSGLKSVLGAKVFAADVNGDKYPDLLVISGVDYFNNRKAVSLFINEQSPSSSNPKDRFFVNHTEGSGINANPNAADTGRVVTALALADVDNDGDIDLVTGVYWHRLETSIDRGDRTEVLLNDGKGKFAFVPNNGLHEVGRLNTQGISFLDYDKDGIIDVFLGNWSEDHTNNVFQRSVLMHGKGDGTFTDKSWDSKINSENPEPLYGCSAGDWNNDGWSDIFTAPYCRTKGSLWKNNADGTFANVAKEVGYDAQFMKGDNGQELCMWAAYPSDYDNDGDYDFFFTLVHGGLNAGEGHSTIVQNLGPDSAFHLKWRLDLISRNFPRPNHQADYEACWFDMDNDGLQDLLVGQGSYDGNPGRVYFFRQQTDHTMKDISTVNELNVVRNPFRPVNRVRVLDYDLDGDDDVLLSAGTNNELNLLRNEAGGIYNHISFNVTGPKGVNRNAIGTNIKVYYPGGIQMREIYAGQGNAAGQNPLIQNFGLGKENKVDSVVFTLPDKQQTHWVLINPMINVLHEISAEKFTGDFTSDENQIYLFPNPLTSGNLKVQIKSGFFENELKLELWNNAGQIIRDAENFNQHNVTLNLNSLTNGVYFLKAIPDKGKPAIKKFVVIQ